MKRVSSFEKSKVAIYIRLSREDGDDRESESVENQRDLIENYIEEHESLEKAGEYVDDGFTGTNFNRPGFKKMIEDIEAGTINCIITKDLSRFGRDHIDTGYYLERYLPQNNIRYIAIGDNVDTLKSEGLQFLTFKLSFNDYYAQDISNKIKSVKERKIEKGEYQAGIPPYGYRKDPNKKNHLIPDEEAAYVVKEIFDMYVNKGLSTIKIADELNKKEILPPAMYLKIPTFIRKESKNPDGKYVWLRAQIGKILKNEVYLGNVVGRKFQKVSHKIEKVRCTRPEEHIVVPNMHEPIIDNETWEKAQSLLNSFQKSRDRKYDHPLKGLVYCGECSNKATLRCKQEIRKTGKVWQGTYFICSKRNNYSGLCECKQISALTILNVTKKAIIDEMKKINYSKKELEIMYKEAEKKSKSRKVIVETKLKDSEDRFFQKEREIEEIYRDKINKVISAEDFSKIYSKMQKEKEQLKHQIESLKDELQNEEIIKKPDYKKVQKTVDKFLEMENLDKKIYSKLVEKIEFDKDKNINVRLTFSAVKPNHI